jgi:hypothetical protein
MAGFLGCAVCEGVAAEAEGFEKVGGRHGAAAAVLLPLALLLLQLLVFLGPGGEDTRNSTLLQLNWAGLPDSGHCPICCRLTGRCFTTLQHDNRSPDQESQYDAFKE